MSSSNPLLPWGGVRASSRPPTRRHGNPRATARPLTRGPAVPVAVPEPALRGLRRAAWVLLCISIVLYLSVSALLLERLGIPYDLPGGSPLVKFHPGTYALVAAALLALGSQGHPLRTAIERLRREPALTLYLSCIAFLMFWSLWRNGTSGAAFIVDSLMAPGLAWMVVLMYPARQQRALVRLVLLMLALNAVIALVEFATRWRLLAFGAGELLMLADARYFRSSALLGHPLVNSMVTLALLPAVWLVREWGAWRWVLGALLGVSLLAFGSRASLAVAVVVYGGALLLVLAWQAASGRFSYTQVLGGVLALLLGSTAIVGAAWVSGLGARIFANMAWDNSADVRLVVWRALDHLRDFEWWVGVSPARVREIAQLIGLDPRFEAIENFWIELLMQWGLVGFVPFVVSVVAALTSTLRRATPPMWLALPTFLVVASGANTLSTKTVSLTLVLVVASASGAWHTREGR